jgi:hypothetical protein
VPRSQCLDRRIDSKKHLVSEIAAWEHQRNTSRTCIEWMLTKARKIPGIESSIVPMTRQLKGSHCARYPHELECAARLTGTESPANSSGSVASRWRHSALRRPQAPRECAARYHQWSSPIPVDLSVEKRAAETACNVSDKRHPVAANHIRSQGRSPAASCVPVVLGLDTQSTKERAGK